MNFTITGSSYKISVKTNSSIINGVQPLPKHDSKRKNFNKTILEVPYFKKIKICIQQEICIKYLHTMSSVLPDLESSSEDPTAVVKVMQDYKAMAMRRSTSSTSASAFNKQATNSTQKHLSFEDSAFHHRSSVNTPQFPPRGTSRRSHLGSVKGFSPTLGPDPLESMSLVQSMRREAAERSHSGSSRDRGEEQLAREVERLKMALIGKEAQLVEARTSAEKWEADGKQYEMLLKKERMAAEEERIRRKREKKRDEDEKEELRFRLEQRKRREQEAEAEDVYSRQKAAQKRRRLEDSNLELGEQSVQMNESYALLEHQLETERRDAADQLAQLNHEINELTGELEHERAQKTEMAEKSREGVAYQQKYELAKVELKQAQEEAARLRQELEQNEEATKTRKAMMERLNHYPKLVRQNEALKSENKLLTDTAENAELLKEQIEDLKAKVERAEVAAESGRQAKADLTFVREELQAWKDLCSKILNKEERRLSGSSICPDTLEAKIGRMQREDLALHEKIDSLETKYAMS